MESNTLNIETVKIRKYQNSFSNNDIIGHIRLLTEDDLPSIINLQQTIVNNLSDANIFEPSSEKLFYECISMFGQILGIFVEKQLISYCIIYFPRCHQDNLGYELNLPPEELNQVAHLESAIVHPDYRGNSLMLRMNIQALKMIDTSKYFHVGATVSPQNPYSLNVLLKLGLVIRALQTKYRNKWRYIVYKNLAKELAFCPEKPITIATTDIITQQDLLQQGWVGYQMEITPEGGNIMFYSLPSSAW
jgi:RimJ/RimL family protein N-acetyltransferase